MTWEEAPRWMRLLVWVMRVKVRVEDTETNQLRCRRITFHEAWEGGLSAL